MKKIIVVLFFTIFSNQTYSSKLDDIQTRLDDIEWEQMMRESQSSIENDIRLKKNQGININSKFISSNSLITKDDKIIQKNEKNIYALKNNSINAVGEKIYLLSVINESTVPHYDEKKKREYVGSIIYFVIDCKNTKSGIKAYSSYDREFKEVNNLEIPFPYIQYVQFNKTPQSSYIQSLIKTVCY
jgi:hypothetical protein